MFTMIVFYIKLKYSRLDIHNINKMSDHKYSLINPYDLLGFDSKQPNISMIELNKENRKGVFYPVQSFSKNKT